MTKSIRFSALILLAAVVSVLPTQAQTSPPAVFFTDLTSGPNTGGQNNNGTILTIYGKRFGASQGGSTVSIGGGNAAVYLLWSDTKISVAVGAAAQTGSIVVKVGGVSSRCGNNDAGSGGCTFTVRSGNIYCVSTSGSDSNAGTFAGGCWATPAKAKNTMVAGDIVYLLSGLNITAQDNYGATVSLCNSPGGTVASPIAFVGYPGASVTIGTSSGSPESYRAANVSCTANNMVFANQTLLGGFDVGGGVDSSTGWRLVGNNISCPSGNGQTGCVAMGRASNIYFYGNLVTNTGVPGASKQYHSVYFTTDDNHVWAGWNTLHDNRTCRDIQFHSSPLSQISGSGQNQFDLHVHDNLIYNNPCDGINFATVDPSKGAVEAYNNVIFHVGAGPTPPDGDANYTCIYDAGITNAGSAGSGAVEVFNNTVYDCGAKAAQLNNGWGGAFGAFNPGGMHLRNNIVLGTAGEFYLQSNFSGSCDSNIWAGLGSAPSICTNSITSDPLFSSLSSRDFHLQSGSPAIDSGINTGISADFDGISRPQGKAFDRGAFEFASGSGTPPPPKPNPPTNLVAVPK